MSIYNDAHFIKVCLSNNENEDPFDLVKDCVKYHTTDIDNTIVAAFFNNQVGRFLSIGANSGNDQTYQLLVNGWQGVYCDPDPYACAKLIETTKNFKDQVTIINCAITPTGGITDFYLAIDHSVISSLDSSWIDAHKKNTTIRKIIVNSLKFDDILKMFDYTFDYIQTDIEGYDAQVIESINWAILPSCKMICTEAGPTVLKQLCQQGNYMITDITPTNSFYCKRQYL